MGKPWHKIKREITDPAAIAHQNQVKAMMHNMFLPQESTLIEDAQYLVLGWAIGMVILITVLVVL